ncbi:MAG: hypothetical protein WD100_10575 [Tistlia sp.]|uniref:hypothetical protein n=1 Tax=Tistlia sp. TaxID=3057121 RepID=UPI0034A267B2
MATERRYVVTFYKTITTDYGHDKEIEERVLEVTAVDEQTALERAQAEFCRLKELSDWRLHADRCAVEEGGSST